MKTTFDIPEPLLRDVQSLARERKTTTKSLVEEALRRLLDEHDAAQKPFKLRDVSVGDPHVVSPYSQMTWEQQRDLMYGLDP